MKIASISDIHGNLDALKYVISDIEEQGIDKIFICGDLVMAGSEPVKTLDYIIELQKNKDVVIIQGNTDEMIVKSKGNDEYTPPNQIMASALNYAQAVLREDQKEFLSQLPAKYEETIGKLKILAVHGSPRKNNEDILPDMPTEKLQEIISGTDADIILCGHTHIPVIYNVGKQVIVNDGSVGRPFSGTPKACYAIIDYPDLNKDEFSANHRLVWYDYGLAAEKMAKLPFRGAVKLSHMLVNAS